MYKLLMLFLCVCWGMTGVAQLRKVVTGAVQDSIRHDPVPGVKVTVWPDTSSVQTNQYGLFRIEVLTAAPTWFSNAPDMRAKLCPSSMTACSSN